MTKSSDLRYTCKRCGRRTGNYSEYIYGRGKNKVGESYCDECIDELLARVDWENEHFRESSVICPWCGHEDHDGFELDEGEHEDFACRSCGKPFDLEVEVSTEYTTRRNIKYMPKGFGTDGERQRDGVFDDH